MMGENIQYTNAYIREIIEKHRVDTMPYYIPIEGRNTYMRFREALEDSESPNIDEFINELLDLKEDQDANI